MTGAPTAAALPWPPFGRIAVGLPWPVFGGAWQTSRLAPPVAAGRVDRDEDLVARAVEGDPGAFQDLYHRHVDRVWQRLTRILGPDPDREDLTQQIFLEVFRGLGAFRGDARFATYLYRVALNTALDHLGQRRRRPLPLTPDVLDALTSAELSPELRAQERERLALIWTLLDRIKPKKRIAFILRVIEGLSLEEIGDMVGASVPTVAQRVRAAHDELQSLMARHKEALW